MLLDVATYATQQKVDKIFTKFQLKYNFGIVLILWNKIFLKQCYLNLLQFQLIYRKLQKDTGNRYGMVMQ